MDSTTIIIIVVIVVVLVGMLVSYRSRHKYSYNPEQLKKAVDEIFAEAGKNEIDRKPFLEDLRHKFDCTRKEALYLYGAAHHLGYLKVKSHTVEKA